MSESWLNVIFLKSHLEWNANKNLFNSLFLRSNLRSGKYFT